MSIPRGNFFLFVTNIIFLLGKHVFLERDETKNFLDSDAGALEHGVKAKKWSLRRVKNLVTALAKNVENLVWGAFLSGLPKSGFQSYLTLSFTQGGELKDFPFF